MERYTDKHFVLEKVRSSHKVDFGVVEDLRLLLGPNVNKIVTSPPKFKDILWS